VLTVVNLGLAGLDEGTHPLVSAAITASVIVLLFNPLYGRLKAVIDRLFFRDRYDAQRALERLVDAMTTERELPRIAGLIRDTVEVVFRPSMVALFVSEEGRAAIGPCLGPPTAGCSASQPSCAASSGSAGRSRGCGSGTIPRSVRSVAPACANSTSSARR
jgi:hypothetical protein